MTQVNLIASALAIIDIQMLLIKGFAVAGGAAVGYLLGGWFIRLVGRLFFYRRVPPRAVGIVENLTLTGAAAINGTGNDFANILIGNTNANTLDVTRGIEQALAEMAPGLPGITVDTSVYRPADYIETAIRNVDRAGTILRP